MVITVSSIKGGVGKSSVVLLLANNLASRGRKVLVIDTDLNNTVTVYYTMGIGRIGEICERQNVSLAFAQGKLDGKNIIQSRKENIFIVPSSLRLLDQRSMESVEIKRVLRSPKGFDDIIIAFADLVFADIVDVLLREAAVGSQLLDITIRKSIDINPLVTTEQIINGLVVDTL